jgi:D-alanine-D-alanine ligase
MPFMILSQKAMEEMRKIRLGILFGGRSGEHEVSIASAASAIAALDPEEFEVIAIGIKKTGDLASEAEMRNMLPPEVSARVSAYKAQGNSTGMVRLTSDLHEAGGSVGVAPEIIFPLLHGPYGEDGTVQGLLEIAGLPYIGCGVLASAVGMDKDVMKRLFMQAGLPVLPFCVARSHEMERSIGWLRNTAEAQLGYPMFSKPANLGSSVGVRKIHSSSEFEDAVRHSAQFDRKVVIEKGIEAREIECAILGNSEPIASTVGEVIPGREFYDYEAKYVSTDSKIEIPARISETMVEEIRKMAIRAFQTIDASGLARVDFFLDKRSDRIWLNEVNTMPGFTPISMYTKLWAASGVPFTELVRRLVNLGFERYQMRSEQLISAF